MTALLLALSVQAAQPSCARTYDGQTATAVCRGPKSVKAKNWWSDRERQRTGHLFARDEGMDGSNPLVDLVKGGI